MNPRTKYLRPTPNRVIRGDALEGTRGKSFLGGSEGFDDARWPLWQELRAALLESPGNWKPLRILGSEDEGEWGVLAGTRIVIDFDGRMSQPALLAAIRRAWPELKKQGYRRQTSPLGARSIALVRHVCFNCDPADSWEQRFKTWRDRYPQWPFRDRRAFITSLHRAEKSLTGDSRGLQLFYDVKARALWKKGPPSR